MIVIEKLISLVMDDIATSAIVEVFFKNFSFRRMHVSVIFGCPMELHGIKYQVHMHVCTNMLVVSLFFILLEKLKFEYFVQKAFGNNIQCNECNISSP